jgi:hypothetical protein
MENIITCISTEECSLAQQYVSKLINQAIFFSYTTIIRPIYYHLFSYICQKVIVDRPDDGCIAETCSLVY